MRLAIYLLISFIAFPLAGQKDGFIELVKENISTLKLAQGAFSGDGATILRDGIAEAQFVLLGEQHGLSDVQEFAAALYTSAHEHGFNYMAIETDPFAAGQVGVMAQQSEEDITDFFATYPMAIPFFYSQEGMQYARAVQAAGGGQPLFWGLDQVFMVGPRFIFTELKDMATTDAARALAIEYYEKANALFGEAMGSGNPGGVILMTMEEDDFSALRGAFDDNETALEMIEQLELSKQIYRHWFDGEYYQNNSVRSNLMKRLFREYYQQAIENDGELPRVVFKFGSNHCVRGLTSTHMYDLGNMVSSLADMNGTKSFHIKLTAARGTAFNALQGPQEFDATEDWHAWLQEAIKPALEASPTDWLLVDMRPVRNLRLKNADESIKSLVFGFDVWVIIPEGHAATPFR